MAGSIQRATVTLSARLTLTAALALLPMAARPEAHDIPASVLVQAIARVEPSGLRLLLRVPLVSMRDFNFPSRPAVLDSPMLDVAGVQPLLAHAAELWLAQSAVVWEGETRLGTPVVSGARLALPTDRSFESYEAAVQSFTQPLLPAGTSLSTAAALLDVMLDYRIASAESRFSIDPQFGRLGLRVMTTLRFRAPGAPERAFQFSGDPGLVRLDPRWHQAARTFVSLGFAHILDGIDHLLFLFCLVLPIRRFGQLVLVVTAFTVAHSLTLFGSAFGLAPDALWFPPLVETLIALSIVYMAIENIVVAVRARSGDGVAPRAVRGRWMIAFAFGLVHGFGFSFALKETLQLAGAHLVTSLLAFNVGVELGQLLVLVVLVPAVSLLFKRAIEERLGIIMASALVTHTAWHWMTDRGEALLQYDVSLGPAALARLLRVLMVVVAVAGGWWLWRAARSRTPQTHTKDTKGKEDH